MGVAVMTSRSQPGPLHAQGRALVDAEAMLFVDDDERQVREAHLLAR